MYLSKFHDNRGTPKIPRAASSVDYLFAKSDNAVRTSNRRDVVQVRNAPGTGNATPESEQFVAAVTHAKNEIHACLALFSPPKLLSVLCTYINRQFLSVLHNVVQKARMQGINKVTAKECKTARPPALLPSLPPHNSTAHLPSSISKL